MVLCILNNKLLAGTKFYTLDFDFFPLSELTKKSWFWTLILTLKRDYRLNFPYIGDKLKWVCTFKKKKDESGRDLGRIVTQRTKSLPSVSPRYLSRSLKDNSFLRILASSLFLQYTVNSTLFFFITIFTVNGYPSFFLRCNDWDTPSRPRKFHVRECVIINWKEGWKIGWGS